MKPDVFYLQAYASDLKYGSALNRHIELLPDNAWIVITDGDVLFLTTDFGRIIRNAIIRHGQETDVFTCQTNRLGDPGRCYKGIRSENDSIDHHVRLARKIEQEFSGQIQDVEDRIIPGLFMLFSKRIWLDNKFDDMKIIAPGGSFDIRWSREITGKMRRIMDLYVWHTYRLTEGFQDTSHLTG